MTESSRSRDRAAAARALYLEWIEAWNRRDAEEMARLTAPAGVVIGFDGSQMTGPEEVAAAIGAVFAHHQTKPYVAVVREIRPLGPDVMLLRAVCGMSEPGAKTVIPAVNALQSLVAVHHDGEWKIALFQNTPAAFHGRPDAAAALTEELNRALNA
jgi:uncharacterized protein (TIGR02246 family)